MTRWRAEQPYNELPSPPSADVLESKAVLKAAIGARAAVAQLDQASLAMPNPDVLINTIPLLEAQASSEIENVVTTSDDLFRHMHDEESSKDPAVRETLRYRTALRVGVDAVADRGLTVGTAERICTTIHGREMRVRDLPGTHIANPVTGKVIYTPPVGADTIRERLAEWEKFVHADDGMDPLVRMAAAHYHFEAIHPFSDGNGRTGRILNILMLVEAGLLRMPVLYLSRCFIQTKDDYYRLLRRVTSDGEWERWIIYVLEGVEATSRATADQIGAIRQLQAAFARRAREASKGGADAEFLAVLFEQPYCRIATVIERCGVSRPTATRWLGDLAEAGMIDDLKVGRDRLFVNRDFLSLLSSDSGGDR